MRTNGQDHTFNLNFDSDNQSLRVSSNRDAIDVTTGNQTVLIQPNETVDVDTLHGTITFDDGTQSLVNRNETSSLHQGRTQRDGSNMHPNFVRRLDFDECTRLNSNIHDSTRGETSDFIEEIDDNSPVVCYQNNKVVHIMYPPDYRGPKVNVIGDEQNHVTPPDYLRFAPQGYSSQVRGQPQNLNETVIMNNNASIQPSQNNRTYPGSAVNDQTINLASQTIPIPPSSRQFQPLFASSAAERSHFPELFSTCDNESNFNDMLQATGNYFSGATQSGVYDRTPAINDQTVNLTQSIAPPVSPRQFQPLFASSAANRSYYPEIFSFHENESNMDDMFQTDSYFDDHPTLDSTGSTLTSNRHRSRSIAETSRDMSSFGNDTSNRSDQMMSYSPECPVNNATFSRSPMRGDATFNQSLGAPSTKRAINKSRTRSPSGFNSTIADQTVFLSDATYDQSPRMCPPSQSLNRTNVYPSGQINRTRTIAAGQPLNETFMNSQGQSLNQTRAYPANESLNKTRACTPNQSDQFRMKPTDQSQLQSRVCTPTPASQRCPKPQNILSTPNLIPPQPATPARINNNAHITTPKSSRIQSMSTSRTPPPQNTTSSNRRDSVTRTLQYSPQKAFQQIPCNQITSTRPQSAPIPIHNPIQCRHTGAPVNHACRGAIPKTRRNLDVEEAVEAIELASNMCQQPLDRNPNRRGRRFLQKFKKNKIDPCVNVYKEFFRR